MSSSLEETDVFVSHSENPLSSEKLYFQNLETLSTLQNFATDYVRSVNSPSLTQLTQNWFDSLSPNWTYYSRIASLSDAYEFSARAAVLGICSEMSSAQIFRAGKNKLPLSDLMILSSVKKLRGGVSDDVSNGVPAEPESTSLTRYLEPHTQSKEINACVSDVASIGPLKKLSQEGNYHKYIVFVSAILFGLDANQKWIVPEVILLARNTIVNNTTPAPLSATTDFPFATALIFLLSEISFRCLFSSIIFSVILQYLIITSSTSEYEACHFLSLPFWLRFLDLWLFFVYGCCRYIATYALLFLQWSIGNATITNSALADGIIQFFPGAITAVMSAGVVAALLVRSRFSTRSPDKQLCRTFPRGQQQTDKWISRLLLATGFYNRKQSHLAFRQEFYNELPERLDAFSESDACTINFTEVSTTDLSSARSGERSDKTVTQKSSARESKVPSSDSTSSTVPLSEDA